MAAPQPCLFVPRNQTGLNINGVVMLSEAKHLRLYFRGDRSKNSQRFLDFARNDKKRAVNSIQAAVVS